MTGPEARARVVAFLAAHPGLFAVIEEPGKTPLLLERATGKLLAVDWNELAEVVERAAPLRPHPYLVLRWSGGRQVALADVGFAFAPSTQSTGPLDELPATFCFRDFHHLARGVEAMAEEEGRELEALRGVMLSIALVDGARLAGFEVAREERTLERLLARLEERGVKL